MRRWRERAAAATAPRPDGLPNALVLGWFPGLLAVAVAVLTVLNLNGSSTGALWRAFHKRPDPDLLAGTVRPIRTDEWLVQSSWVVSQVSQGFPRRNTVFPGGMDATVMNDLPTWDWSGLFRPHTWGFLALGLDHGMAIRWWLPAALMLAAVYVFAVSVLPRRPLLAATLALVVLFQPEVQWWWLPILPHPVAFAFATMTAVVWGYRCTSRVGRIVPAAAAGYLAVDMAMGIYVPFMIPAVLAAAAFVVGFVLREWRQHRLSWREFVGGLAPLAVAGMAAAAILAVWLATRRNAVEAIVGTVYPGRRVTPPGSLGEADLLSLASAPFQRWLLSNDAPSPLGPNQAEASTAVLVGLYLIVPLAWVTWAQWRRSRSLDWTVLALIAVQALVLAFLYVPGWDRLAGLTGLDRSMPQRLRLLFVITIVVAVVLLVERLDALGARAPWVAALAAGAVVLVSGAWAWHRLDTLGSSAATATSVVVVVLLAVAVVAVARRALLVGGSLLLLGSLVVGFGVTPLNRGVFDLRTETKAGQEVRSLAAARPHARWVAVGSNLSSAILVESGVPAYVGVQTYPAQPMWDQIDPTGGSEGAWNRLANLSWVAGAGDPAPRQPASGAADQVEMTFDSCAAFAQRYVAYVLADGGPIRQDCLRLVDRVREVKARQWIYRVVPAGSAGS